MAYKTNIGWCDHTFNPWMGCTKVSPACDHCYAEELMANTYKKVEWGPDAKRKRTSDANWKKVRKWNADAEKRGVLETVFCASLADVAEYKSELAEIRADLITLIRECKSLVFLLLTKRPQNLKRMFPEDVLRRCGVGITAEDQKWYDKRLPHLAQTPARFRFLSIEPLLSPLNLGLVGTMPKTWGWGYQPVASAIDWIIVGGESGRYRREMDMEVFEDVCKQVVLDNIPLYVKQDSALKPEQQGRINDKLWACKQKPELV